MKSLKGYKSSNNLKKQQLKSFMASSFLIEILGSEQKPGQETSTFYCLQFFTVADENRKFPSFTRNLDLQENKVDFII